MVNKANRSANRRESIAAELPIELYEHARRRLLVNEPMIGYAVPGGSAAQALTAGKIDALESVGLSTAAWSGSAKQNPLMHSISYYMALIETSFTTERAAYFLKVSA